MTVSVALTAYQHEAYLGKALDSVLRQSIDDLEIVVGVDASFDATAEIASAYARRDARIRLLLHPERVGLARNFAATYMATRGELVALLEGDDYWTVADKLSRQVDALRRHGGALCGHTTLVIGANHGWPETIPTHPAVAFDRARFVRSFCNFHTSSLLFPRFADGLPAHVTLPDNVVVDLPLKLALAARGEVRFLPETMSVFRRVTGSASSAIDNEAWRAIMRRAYRNAREEFSPPLRRIVDDCRAELFFQGALSTRSPLLARAWFAAQSLALRPGTGSRQLARHVYARMPSSMRDLYRSARQRWRRRGGEAPAAPLARRKP